jgi:hypothetical protein
VSTPTANLPDAYRGRISFDRADICAIAPPGGDFGTLSIGLGAGKLGVIVRVERNFPSLKRYAVCAASQIYQALRAVLR